MQRRRGSPKRSRGSARPKSWLSDSLATEIAPGEFNPGYAVAPNEVWIVPLGVLSAYDFHLEFGRDSVWTRMVHSWAAQPLGPVDAGDMWTGFVGYRIMDEAARGSVAPGDAYMIPEADFNADVSVDRGDWLYYASFGLGAAPGSTVSNIQAAVQTNDTDMRGKRKISEAEVPVFVMGNYEFSHEDLYFFANGRVLFTGA